MDKSKKIEPRTLPGFMELLPESQIKFNEIKNTIKNVYERYGFLPLDTPIIEDSKILLAKAGGETEKQIYRFNKGENDLCLRFDLTVPLAKYVSQYQNELTFPFRRYQIGKVYRGEKQQRGRFREFYQCDIDIIGDETLSIINDAELPSIIYNVFKELNFGKFTICINNRKILNGLFQSLKLQESATDILRIIDKIDKIGKSEVVNEMKKIEVDEESIDTILKFISIDGTVQEKFMKLQELNIENDLFIEGITELQEVVKYIKMFGVPEEYFCIDLKIARGLDYYTGTVYETFLDEYKNLGSVCSGGRYDNLAEYYTDKKLPGVGISIGLTRLFYQLNEINLINSNKSSISNILIIPMEEKYMEESINVATYLRNNDVSTELYINDKKIKQKMKYADKLKIPYVLIIGEDEVKSKLYTLKNMITGKQETLKIEEVVEKIKNCKG